MRAGRKEKREREKKKRTREAEKKKKREETIRSLSTYERAVINNGIE